MGILIGLPIAIGLWIGLWHLWKHAVGWYPGGGFWRAVLFVVLLPVGCLICASPWAFFDMPENNTGHPDWPAAILSIAFILAFAWFGSGVPKYLRNAREVKRQMQCDAAFTAAGRAWAADLERSRLERP